MFLSGSSLGVIVAGADMDGDGLAGIELLDALGCGGRFRCGKADADRRDERNSLHRRVHALWSVAAFTSFCRVKKFGVAS